MGQGESGRLARRVIDAHYVEAMLLMDEARSYFEAEGRDERQTLDGAARVTFACESLKVTTRLMHIVAWLLMRRAVAAGEPGADARSCRLGAAIVSDADAVALLPARARLLIAASEAQFDAIARLDAASLAEAGESPALALRARLAEAF